MASTNNHRQVSNDARETNHTNSAFEVVEKHDVETNDARNSQINVSNLSSMAPNALFNSFPKEYIETLILRLNEGSTDNDVSEMDSAHNALTMERLKNIGGTLAQRIPTLFKKEEDNKQSTETEDDEYEYQYYHTKMNHDIAWNNTHQNDELFVISKELFDDSGSGNDEANGDSDGDTITHELVYPIARKEKWNSNAKKKKAKPKAKAITASDPSDETKSWSQSLNSMLIHAKHRMYTMLANPSFKWDSRQNRHLFSLSEDVWIMGNHYQFNNSVRNSNKHVMQSIVLDIYSKVWITYRSKFEEILASHYTSDAGWGCMLRTTQMMTAQALIIYYFDYKWNLTKLDMNDSSITLYYDCVLSLFNDSSESALSIHKMISYGSVLYNKPVGHWYGPMQTCIMIRKCIESYPKLANEIECIVSDSGAIYKSELINIATNLKKHALIFLPLRLGLDSLNFDYIESIKKCFHLTECIGIIGGKPQRSLYFIGYQGNNLFYLDPHTVFPVPNLNKPLSSQRCVFHCQEINSLPANELDPSMAVAFFIKPSQIHLDNFWNNAMALTNHDKYSIFSLSQNRPNWKLNSNHHSDSNLHLDLDLDHEWEKI